jgi:hypothetical protein
MSNYAFFRFFCQENLPGSKGGFSQTKRRVFAFFAGFWFKVMQ